MLAQKICQQTCPLYNGGYVPTQVPETLGRKTSPSLKGAAAHSSVCNIARFLAHGFILPVCLQGVFQVFKFGNSGSLKTDI